MSQTNSKQTAKSKSAMPPVMHDAIALLIDDHKKVKKMFKQFEKLKESSGSNGEKAGLVEKICHELTVHATVEEEIFYPAVRAAIDNNDLVDEAEVEHAEVKKLISQLEDMEPEDDKYDAIVKVLSENIDHHVEEEQNEMFPQAKESSLDMADLGMQIMARKNELEDEND